MHSLDAGARLWQLRLTVIASITIIIVFHRPRFIINSNKIDFLMPRASQNTRLYPNRLTEEDLMLTSE